MKRYKYNGKERDEESGLDYYGARYYASWLCRFISVDPLKDSYPFQNSFTYADNNPITLMDINGEGTGGDDDPSDAQIVKANDIAFRAIDKIGNNAEKAGFWEAVGKEFVGSTSYRSQNERGIQLESFITAEISKHYDPDSAEFAQMFNLTLGAYEESAYLSRSNPDLYQAFRSSFNDANSIGEKLYAAVSKSYEVYKRNQAFSIMGLTLDAYAAAFPGTQFSKGRPIPKNYSVLPRGIGSKNATVGFTKSFDYKKTFFNANPGAKGEVVVHHAVEQQVLKRYPGLFKEGELHSLENLRGIPKNINSDLHLSKIRKAWNKFYRTNANPSRQDVLDKATEIDNLYGNLFNPSIR